MMGTRAAPDRLFYDFSIDDHVPADHLLRQIDRFLDLGSVRRELAGHYSNIGRPSVDPGASITPHHKWGIHSTYTDNLMMLTLNRGGPVV